MSALADEMKKAVGKAVEESGRTCERCGGEGRLFERMLFEGRLFEGGYLREGGLVLGVKGARGRMR